MSKQCDIDDSAQSGDSGIFVGVEDKSQPPSRKGLMSWFKGESNKSSETIKEDDDDFPVGVC